MLILSTERLHLREFDEGDAGFIHALLTDLVMPRMGGRELARQLTEQRPPLRVLFMSGHPKDAFQPPGDVAGVDFVQKPFSPLALARQVRQLLDSKAGP